MNHKNLIVNYSTHSTPSSSFIFLSILSGVVVDFLLGLAAMDLNIDVIDCWPLIFAPRAGDFVSATSGNN